MYYYNMDGWWPGKDPLLSMCWEYVGLTAFPIPKGYIIPSPIRFLYFNIWKNFASTYFGAFPWHWYLTHVRSLPRDCILRMFMLMKWKCIGLTCDAGAVLTYLVLLYFNSSYARSINTMQLHNSKVMFCCTCQCSHLSAASVLVIDYYICSFAIESWCTN